MAQKLALGAIVKLKSGGPVMTVNGFLNSGACICSWFDKDFKACRENFFPDALELVEQ